MKVRIAAIFYKKFLKQIDYISNDKPGAARKFKTDIFDKLKELPSMPFKIENLSFMRMRILEI